MVNRNQFRQRIITGTVALLTLGALAIPQASLAAPSQDEINKAQESERIAELSVAQIEVQLSSAQASANQAQVAAQIAAEELNAAQLKLDEAVQLAEKTAGEAAKAQTEFEEGRQELATVAQTASRNGSGSLDALAPYLTSDGLATVEIRQNAIDSFGASVDTQLQRVAALQQVARVMAESAENAKQEETDAVAQVADQEAQARTASEEAQAIRTQTASQRDALVSELAARQNITVELIQEQQAAIERQREEAARQAVLERADAEEAARKAGAEQEAAVEDSWSGGGDSSSSSSSGSSGSSDGYTPPPAPAPEPEPAPAPAPTPPPVSSGSGAQGAINFAMSLQGAPYVWGGEGPGYDCSGLVTAAYRSVGIYLTHQSRSQWNETYHVPVGSAQPGDLIFWSSNGSSSGIYHVAIYLGGGQIIEAADYGIPLRVTSMYNWNSVMPYAGRVG